MFSRSEQLLGTDVMQQLHDIRVIIFGVGGVGSWCAESLIRTGLHHLTLVDFDTVQASNINRQAMADSATLGQPKAEAMKAHLLTINPEAEIIAVNNRFTYQTSSLSSLDSRLSSFNDYDFVIDAIDSVEDKVALILEATASNATLFSSMGAANKLDPTQIRTAEFWKVRGCPLARALRTRMKKHHTFPSHKFLCVYSEEQPTQHSTPNTQHPGLKGSIMPVTATFGLTLAGLLIKSL